MQQLHSIHAERRLNKRTVAAVVTTLAMALAVACCAGCSEDDGTPAGTAQPSGGDDTVGRFVPDTLTDATTDAADDSKDAAAQADSGTEQTDVENTNDTASAGTDSGTAAGDASDSNGTGSTDAQATTDTEGSGSTDTGSGGTDTGSGGADTTVPTDVVQVGPVGSNGCADGTREAFLDEKAFPKIAACGGAWDIKGIHHGTPKCNREAGNDGKNKDGKGCNVEDLCADGWRVCYGKKDVLDRNPDGCARIMDGVKEPGFFLARTSSTGAFNCSQDSTKFGDPGTVNDLFGCGNLGCGTTQGTCTGNKKGCDPATDCATCAAGDKCTDKTACKASVCFPLNRASHDLCKTLKKMPNCTCTFTDPAKKTVQCSPSSGGCGWCRPVNYYEKLNNTTYPAAWDCGTNGSKEAVNVVKKHAALGGVLCCQM